MNSTGLICVRPPTMYARFSIPSGITQDELEVFISAIRASASFQAATPPHQEKPCHFRGIAGHEQDECANCDKPAA